MPTAKTVYRIEAFGPKGYKMVTGTLVDDGKSTFVVVEGRVFPLGFGHAEWHDTADDAKAAMRKAIEQRRDVDLKLMESLD
jgi:hypothetical protein